MELNSKEIHKSLKSKNINTLHHANTVQTACIFLQNGRLLSRGTVDERRIEQTAQKSDAIDLKYGIWYDIFLDSVDIHERAGRRNLYGPVLFRFNLDVLLENWLPSVWITKKNPTLWKDSDTHSDRYFQSVDEFHNTYKKGNFNSMFMLRHAGGVLRLLPHLKDIVVDDPALEYQEGVDVYSQTVGALNVSAWQGGIKDLKIVKRKCSPDCQCGEQYQAFLLDKTSVQKYGPQTAKLFFHMSAEE
jgi:hypothetical protein